MVPRQVGKIKLLAHLDHGAGRIPF